MTLHLMSEFLITAEAVFRKAKKPMTPREIVTYAKEQAILSDKIAGKTPEQTMKSKLSVDIRKNGASSRFLRTSPGHFYLRELFPKSDQEYMAPPLTPPSKSELLVVLPAELFENNLFEGITSDWQDHYQRLMNSDSLINIPRMEAEATDNFKQLLTYVLVVRDENVLAYQRGNYNRVEDMLKGAQCIGFGGHVLYDDGNHFGADMAGIMECARRELVEELSLSELDRGRLDRNEGLEIVGLLNDNSSDVGRKHFAVILKFTVGDADWVPKRGEKSINQLKWLRAKSNPPIRMHEFEYWSQLCFRLFFPKMVLAGPERTLIRPNRLRNARVICLQGGVGSGKTEVADVLSSHRGYEVINSGKVLAGLMGIHPIPKTDRKVFQRQAIEFINTRSGPETLARALAAEIDSTPSERILIDGIRQVATFECLTKILNPSKVGVVFIQSTPDLAYRLYTAREEGVSDCANFYRILGAPVEQEVGKFLKLADGVLYNYFGKDEFCREILDMFDNWV